MRNKKDIRYYIKIGKGKEPLGATKMVFSYKTTGMTEERFLLEYGYIQVSKKVYNDFIKEIYAYSGAYNPN